MIRIEREPLKFLLRGRIIAVQLDKPRQFKKTRTYAVALPGKRSQTCRVHVLDVDGLVLRIKHAPDARDVPRTLRRGYGYIGDDVAGGGDPLDAGEALPAAVLERYSTESRERHDLIKRAQRAGISLADRLRDLERRAASGDQQARRHLFVIRQRVEAAEKAQARGL